MILKIARYEFLYHFRSLQWSIFFLLSSFAGLLCFPFIEGSGIRALVGINDNVFLNSPFLITYCLLFLSVLGSLAIPSFIAGSALRDSEHRFDRLVYSMPVAKSDYLLGRFSGSFLAMMTTVAGAPMGMLCAEIFIPFTSASVGPTEVSIYAAVFFGFVLPGLLPLAVLNFAVATTTRNVLYVYLVVLGSLVLTYLGYFTVFPQRLILEALLDPFMFNGFIDESRMWTTAERNSNLMSYDALRINRLFWFGLAAIVATFAYRSFSFRSAGRAGRSPKKIIAANETVHDPVIETGTVARKVWTRSARFHLYVFRAEFELRAVLQSIPFLILLAITLSYLPLNFTSPLYPVTRLMVEALNERLGPILLFVLVYYAADIIWRERGCKFNEVVDATPAPTWVFVLSKLTALGAVMVTITLLQIGLSVLWQISNGYTRFEPGLYLERGLVYFLLGLTPFVAVSFFIQVLMNSRLLGMVGVSLFLVGMVLIGNLAGYSHPLLLFGLVGDAVSDVAAPLSDMNGSGRFTYSGYWLRAYGLAFAVLAILSAYLFWNRGTLQPLVYRVRNLTARSNRWVGSAASAALLLVIATGGYIYYNMHVLNEYLTDEGLDERKAEYEREYLQYQGLPMPSRRGVRSEVNIYPDRGRVEAHVTETLSNDTNADLTTVHLVFPRGLQVSELSLEGAALTSQEGDFNYSVFDLDTPMRPGEERALYYETAIQIRGFEHRNPMLDVVRNGSYFLNEQIGPHIGFSPRHLILDEKVRARYGLEPLPELIEPEDFTTSRSGFFGDSPDFVSFDTIVSTAANQTAIAPGNLIEEWREDGRRYFHYRADTPIVDLYRYVSAEYEVLRDQWNDVDIDIYYHAAHDRNIGRMMEGAKDSLDYFSTSFSPYQYRHLRIAETPSFQGSAQGWPGMIAISEPAGFVLRPRSEIGIIDGSYLVVAHEIAHQWWANQVMPALAKGHEMLTEALASYSALLVAENEYGYQDVRRLLQVYMLVYFTERGSDLRGELPLSRVVAEDYLTYEKGPLVMYALKDYLSEATVNRVLRRLISLRGYTADATSVDFLNILKEEAGPSFLTLIEDLFEKITLYDLAVTDSRVEDLADGRFRVSVDVEAAKIYADELGNETRTTLDYPVDIGIFLRSPFSTDFTSEDVLYLEKHSADSETATFEVIVDERPFFVGIDPYGKLIDRDLRDNLSEI